MTGTTRYGGELELVRGIASEAAELALKRSKDVTPTEKANHSYVTELDKDLEILIRRRLGEAYPDDRLTGEEFEAEGGKGPRRWSIDPIDGTGNMVHGLPLWAVSIGLIDDGEPVLGVIVVPPLDEHYWAVKGQGAWRDGERLTLEDADVFHRQDNVCLGTNAMRWVDPRTVPGRIRDLGSSCCEQVFLASDRLKACVMLGERTHDIAAGVVIAAEAGCAFATIEGEHLSPAEVLRRSPVSTPTLIATPRRLEAMLRQVRPYPAPPIS